MFSNLLLKQAGYIKLIQPEAMSKFRKYIGILSMNTKIIYTIHKPYLDCI